MTVDQRWAWELIRAEDAGRTYNVGDVLTEQDGRENVVKAQAALVGGDVMLRGQVGGNYATMRVPWTYVTDEIVAEAQRLRTGIA
jgi:hypothetical protein